VVRDWTYCYMTSDGLRHEGEMSAPTKDDVYAELRRRGIRAIKVTERIRPIVRRGLRGLRKRDIAALAVGAVVLAGLAVAVASRLGPEPPPDVGVPVRKANVIESNVISIGDRVAPARPRRQIAISEADLVSIFTHPADRFFARYAAPGRRVAPLRAETLRLVEEDFADALESPLVIREDDPKGVADIKGIVAGIKGEAKMLVQSGRSFSDIVKWLTDRQTMEVDYRSLILKRFEHDIEAANAQLQTLGMEGVEK